MKRSARTIHLLLCIAQCAEASKLIENRRRCENGQLRLTIEYRGKWRGRGAPGAFGKSRAHRNHAAGAEGQRP